MNDTSGAEVSVHVRRGQKDVIYDETHLANKYNHTLRKQNGVACLYAST